MGVATIDLDRARHALLELLAMELIGDEALFDLPMRLSAAGLGRAEIIDFFLITSFDFDERLTEEQQGILGDVAECLVGRQCQARQIIRLKGDPEDPLELYYAVQEQLRNWVPARGAHT